LPYKAFDAILLWFKSIFQQLVSPSFLSHGQIATWIVRVETKLRAMSQTVGTFSVLTWLN
jgi:hypothetical protein